MKRTLTVGDQTVELEIYRKSGRTLMVWEGEEHPLDIVKVEPTSYSIILNGRSVGVNIDRVRHSDPDLHGFRATLYDAAYEFTLQDPHKRLLAEAMKRQKQGGAGVFKAPIPGKVVKFLVHEGEAVEEGTPLLILEAMKMQNEIKSPVAGRVERIHCKEGSNLEKDAPMITLVKSC